MSIFVGLVWCLAADVGGSYRHRPSYQILAPRLLAFVRMNQNYIYKSWV